MNEQTIQRLAEAVERVLEESAQTRCCGSAASACCEGAERAQLQSAAACCTQGGRGSAPGGRPAPRVVAVCLC